MSFDGQTASTLDVIIDVEFPSVPRKPRRSRSIKGASTIEAELLAEAPLHPSGSSIEPELAPLQPFTIATDRMEFHAWLERTGSAALLEVVARAFARHTNASELKVFLETESDEPEEQRALLIASVGHHQQDALERLFSFVASPWWMSVVRNTRNTIVVDIQYT